jgi:hypothetical protein
MEEAGDRAIAAAVPLGRALLRCAVDRYETIALTDSSAYGYDAAARLVTLLDQPNGSAAEKKRAARTLRAIQKKHHALPMEFPPDAVGQ